MSPKPKTTPSRPPVKPRQSLPAPRVAPKRVHLAWYQRRPVQVIGGLIVLGLLIFGVVRVFSFWHHHETTMKNKAGVKAFDSQFQSGLAPLQTVFSQISNSPQQFVAGTLTPATYATQTAQWLASIRALNNQLSAAKPPAVIQVVRGLLVQGNDLFVDGIKVLQLAGSTSDPTLRRNLVAQGSNVIFHATSVFKNAEVEEARVVQSYHLSSKTPLPLPDAPSETVTVSSSPAPTPAPSSS